MKKSSLYVFLAIVVVLVGCQPIAPTDAIEVDQLREQNQILSQQLLESQIQIQVLQGQVTTLSTQVAQLTPKAPMDPNFEGLAAVILPLLQTKDFATLASFIDPQAGLRFSPQLFIHTDTDLVFTKEEVAKFATDNAIYTWGTHAAKGDLLELSIVDYWNEYVVPVKPDQQWQMLPEGQKSPSIAIDNFGDVYPKGSYIDFIKPGTEEFGNLDWQLLRLAFEQADDRAYYLAGIIHDNWVP